MLDDEGEQTVNDLLTLYRNIGVTCFSVSAAHDDLNDVKNILENKITLVAGHSGVGKSTLLNKIAPNIGQATGSVSEFSSKGTHTTTFAEMFQLHDKTFVIDTPGVKELGLVRYFRRRAFGLPSQRCATSGSIASSGPVACTLTNRIAPLRMPCGTDPSPARAMTATAACC